MQMQVAKLEAGLAAETRSGMRAGIQEELDTAHYKHRSVRGDFGFRVSDFGFRVSGLVCMG